MATSKFEHTLLTLSPFIVTLLMVLLGVANKHMGGVEYYVPWIVMVAVFYWGIFMPSTMPYWAVFLLGIIQDILCGQIIGVMSLLYLLLRLVVGVKQDIFLKGSFLVLWGGFMVISLMLSGMHWILYSILLQTHIPAGHLMIQWGITVLSYPLLHAGFTRLYVIMSE